MRVSMTVLALALAAVGMNGCSSEGEHAGTVESAMGENTPLVIHYGFLQTNGRSENPQADAAATSRLIVSGVENVVVTTRPLNDAANQAWKQAGGHLAKRLSMEQVIDALAASPNDPIAADLASWDYVAIDELQPAKAARIRDGAGFAKRFAAMLSAHPDRVILYGNTYDMIGVPLKTHDEYQHFSIVMKECATSCKAFASQVYLATPEAFPPHKGVANHAGCANGLRCIGWTARQLETVAPHIRRKLVHVIDVRHESDPQNGKPAVPIKPANDARSWCTTSATGGAMQREIAKARALKLRGFGTFALTHVGFPLKGETFDSARASFIKCARQGATRLPGRSGLQPLDFTIHPRDAELDPVDDALDRDPEIANDLDPDFEDADPAPATAPGLPAFPKPSRCGLMVAGEALAPNDSVSACDGLSFLVYQGDGNVVVYEKYPDKIVPVWATMTVGTPLGALVMQGDGNLVLYTQAGQPLWASGTDGHPGSRLQIQDDCKLVAATPANTAAWATNSKCRYDGVDANEGFVLSYFKAYNPDVVSYGTSHGWTDASYIHYWDVNYDRARCRQASPVFHAAFYLGAQPDVNAAYGGDCIQAMNHWLTFGNHEGRRSSAEFDPRYYLAANPDVAAAYGPHNYGMAAWHYLHAGKNEGRRAAP